jgi:hypothetical protein
VRCQRQTPLLVLTARAASHRSWRRVPLAADMATIINGPMGITESSAMSKSAPPMSSAVHSKRVELKEMLIGRLCKMHGADPVRRAVIEREVVNSSVLQSGKLSAQALASLERAVADAVRATQPGPMVSHQKPAQDCTKVWKAGEMAAAVKKASNWTEVSGGAQTRCAGGTRGARRRSATPEYSRTLRALVRCACAGGEAPRFIPRD